MRSLLQDEKDKISVKFYDKKKKNIMLKQFVSVFTKERNAEVLVFDKKTEANLPNINITEGMVWNKILKLNVNRSCRLDEMYPQNLIDLVDLVTKPLALFLNKTMDEFVYSRTRKFNQGSTNISKRS